MGVTVASSGYQSYGWLVLPTQIYNKVKEAQGKEGILENWEDQFPEYLVEQNDEYTTLGYDNISSHPNVKMFYQIVNDLEQQHNDYGVGKIITPEDSDYMWSVTKKFVGDTTINQFVGPQEITQSWDWAYAEKGEDPMDYTIKFGDDDFGIRYYTTVEGQPDGFYDRWIFMSVKDKSLRDNLKRYIEDRHPSAKIQEVEETGYGEKEPNYILWADTYFELKFWEMQLGSQEKALLNTERQDNSFAWAGVYDGELEEDEEAYLWEIYEYGNLVGPSI